VWCECTPHILTGTESRFRKEFQIKQHNLAEKLTSLTSFPGRMSRRAASKAVEAACKTSACSPSTGVFESGCSSREWAATAMKPSMCAPISLQGPTHLSTRLNRIAQSSKQFPSKDCWLKSTANTKASSWTSHRPFFFSLNDDARECRQT
jgi:hypothetical protein